MLDLSECRERINAIDTQIMDLFRERMEVTADVAQYKAATGMPIFDAAREQANIEHASSQVPPELASYAAILETVLMEASREAQHQRLRRHTSRSSAFTTALANQPAFFPRQATVSCQGVAGAYQQLAVQRLFSRSSIVFHERFEDVFDAVESGQSEFGVLPIENSTAGSVNLVYDLMKRHAFHIVRTCRLHVEHCLLARPGTRLEDITDVYSHEQALHQCASYLENMSGAATHALENTAKAAELVAHSGRSDKAAIASRECAQIYGLDILEHGIQDHGLNYTRFACIAKDLTIYPGADRSSFIVTLNHEPGALYKVLAKFYALDINLIKLESRPIPGRDFEFLFYFDVECPAAAPEFLTLMDSLADICADCRYLGSYQEVV